MAETRTEEWVIIDHLALACHKASQAIAMLAAGESGWIGAARRAKLEIDSAADFAERAEERYHGQ